MSESGSSSSGSDSGRSRSRSSSNNNGEKNSSSKSGSGDDGEGSQSGSSSSGSGSTSSTSNSEANSRTDNATSGSESELSAEDLQKHPLYPKYLHWFKQAIIKIKGQKQRPCKDRIMQAIRQYSTSEASLSSDLPAFSEALFRRQMDLAVDGGHLFLVYCNNMESYKDTEYTRKLRKYVVKDDKSARKAVKLSVREIGNPKGSSEETILAYVQCTFSIEVASLGDVVKNALLFLTNKSELRRDGDLYTVVPPPPPAADSSTRPKSSLSSSSVNRSDEKKKKKKRKKKEKEQLDISVEIPEPPLPTKSPKKSKSKSPVKSKSTPDVGGSGSKRGKSSSAHRDRKSSPSRVTSSPEIPEAAAAATTAMEEPDTSKLRSPERKPGMSKLDIQLSKSGSASRSIIMESVNSTPTKKKAAPTTERVQSPTGAAKKEMPVKKKRGRPFKIRPQVVASTSALPPVKAKSPPRKAPTSTSESDEPPNPLYETLIQSTPKELRDGLSLYFTPSLKRKSRVAMNSLMSNAVPSPAPSTPAAPPTPRPPRPPKAPKAPKVKKEKVIVTTDSEADSARRPKSEVGTTETDDTGTGGDSSQQHQRRRGKKTGSMQLKGLQDGLSRYFTAPEGDRKRRPPPVFTPSRGAALLNAPRSVEKKEEKVSSESENESSAVEPSPSRNRSEGNGEVRSRDSSRSGFRVPDAIPKHYEDIFRKARQKALEVIPTVDPAYEGPLPPHVQIGKWKIRTWYTSPFPEEYIRCECLYLCEFCMQYMKTVDVLKSHYAKCPWHRPPGTEIYHDTARVGERQEELIVYETDGNDWKEYCQNLCLLAKLYLDHKTLYYDVEPFLFYVLCRRDEYGDHLIGYFSKEKNSPQRYNVSCIMVLPPYQTSGYGRFLIDFSYLLSRVETTHGTPEKPLSELGTLSYQSYWKATVLDFFVDLQKKSATKISFEAICNKTGMWPQDVADTLQQLNFLQKNERTNTWEIRMIRDVIDDHLEKQAANKKRILLLPDKLRWDPWRGDNMGVTSTESDRSSSRPRNGTTADDNKPADISHDTSDSDEAEQAVEIRPVSVAASARHAAPSRSRTPRGRPSTHRSVSKQRSSPDRSRLPPLPTATAPPDKPRRGRPPKNQARRRSSGREETTGTGTRKRRRGKMRKKTSSSPGTSSSQPKNYKGRGEELRAGGDKHHKHRKTDNNDENSDIASLFSSPRRASSSTSLSSLDESLASLSDYSRAPTPSTVKSKPSTATTDHRAHHSRQSRRSLDRESLASERSSSSGRSHLDQPPRAPHPVELNEPLDLMDAVIVNDTSFLDAQNRTAAPPLPFVHPVAAAPVPVQRGVEICVQTEPDELLRQEALVRVPDVPMAPPVDVLKMPPTLATQTSHSSMNPLSPTVQASQPTTPFAMGSPQMSLGSVGTAPGSVLSNHEMQMTLETDHMVAPSSGAYDNPRSYDSRQYQPRTPATVNLTATSPINYQNYQQASPVPVQVYQDVSRPPTAQPYIDMVRQPHTPVTPQSVYLDTTPRPGTAFGENVHSPHPAGRMPTNYNMPAETYGSVRSQSVAPGYRESGVATNRRGSAHFSSEEEYAQQQHAQYSSKGAPSQTLHAQQLPTPTQSKSRSRQSHAQRYAEPPAAPPYPPHIAAQQAVASAQSPFFFGTPSMHFLPYGAMQEPYPGHYELQAAAAANNELAKISRMAQNLPHNSHTQMVGYQQMTAPPNQRSQSHSRQSAQPPSGPPMRMPMTAAMPPGYGSYGMTNMKNIQQAYVNAGQTHPMAQGYNQAMFGPQGGAMSGPSGQHGGAHQGQAVYQNFYYPGTNHHPGQHHPSMRP